MTAAQRRWRLDLSYDGSEFHGFAAQPGTPTVAGSLSGALATVLRLEVPPVLTCAGRTDAGVHALGQVVHVELPEPLFASARGATPTDHPGGHLAARCNSLLAPRIVVRSAAPAPEGFDARRSATWRRYRYLVHEASVPSPLLASTAWHVAVPLDLKAMQQAALSLLGEHDFRAFCRRPSDARPEDPLTRHVTHVDVDEAADALGLAGGGRVVRVELTATAFCQQMVRSIASALVAVGWGELTAADLVERLRTGDRSGLPAPAPPCGLCLVAVGYA